MKRVLFLQLSALALLFAGCDVESAAQKSVLPQTMPQDFEVKYLESGGFAPVHNSVRIEADTLYVERKAFDASQRAERSAKVSNDDRAALYRAFVENEFDLITYEKTNVYTSDAIVRTISLRAGGKVFTAESDPNKPLSDLNKNRLANVLLAIQNLENKYQREPDKSEISYAVLKADADNLRFIAKNAKVSELNDDEIEKAKKFTADVVSGKIADPKITRSLLPLAEYKFQFVPFVDENGVKNVYVNAFCNDFDMDWKKNLVMVYDGGKCFFNFKLDLQNSTVYDFMVNGEA